MAKKNEVLVSRDQLHEKLHDALDDKLVVEAYLGMGNNIIVGFSDHVLPSPIIVPHPRFPRNVMRQRLEEPPYDISTVYCYWQFSQHGKIFICADSHEDDLMKFDRDMENHAEQLVLGKRVVNWEIPINNGLRVLLDNGVLWDLYFEPEHTVDVTYWTLADVRNCFWNTSLDGTTVTYCADTGLNSTQ